MSKNNIFTTALSVLSLLSLIGGVFLVELTFELSDNAKECFHEEIVNETKCTIEFQVSSFVYFDCQIVEMFIVCLNFTRVKLKYPLAPRNAGAPQNAGFQFLWISNLWVKEKEW